MVLQSTVVSVKRGDGHVKVVIVLLESQETQINQAANDGSTPLLMACQNDHVKVVNALLARKEIQINQAKKMEQHHCSSRVKRVV